MAEGLTTGDGTPVTDVPPIGNEEADFAKLQAGLAAAADSKPTEKAPSPPKKDPAPYGYKADGTPKKAAGRPKKDEATKPRVQSPKGAQAKKDYTADLTGLVQTLWGATAAFAPADAGAIQVHGPGLVKAWNDLAAENAQVAKGIEWLTTGSAYGAVVMTTAPLVLQLLANHGVLPGERLAPLGVQEPAALAQLAHDTVRGMAEQGEV
ncbi:hypothetical protein ACQPZP_14560 [Spirillospora sp. CA-142024]|uniref:hypothetical protein n=1 Tax=Spirillospora sp. CA-142024 TaxID=3240036 RepID=UPI003D91AD29